jgi:hypothetical protein
MRSLLFRCATVALVATAFASTGLAGDRKPHHVAFQIDQNDPQVMNLVLNNATNVVEYYRGKNEDVDVDIVTYGPGLHMLRADTSPVKVRIAEMSLASPEITFAACQNTQVNMAKQEGKEIALVSEARVVPSGVVRLIELQEKGYAYIRPSGR